MVRGSSPRRGRARLAAWAAAAVLVTGAAAAGCGDDNDGGGTAPPSPPETTTSAPPSEPGATQPDDPAAAEREIKENWMKFFDPATSLKDKEALLEDGERMRPVLESFSGDERGRQVTAEVSKVSFVSDKEAEVTYSLALRGATVMPDATGTAVLQDDTWKVSVKALCSLVQLSGNASPAPGC